MALLIQAAFGVHPTERVNDARVIGELSGHHFGQGHRPIEIGPGFSQIEGQIVHGRCVVGVERELLVERCNGLLGLPAIAFQHCDRVQYFGVVRRQFRAFS